MHIAAALRPLNHCSVNDPPLDVDVTTHSSHGCGEGPEEVWRRFGEVLEVGWRKCGGGLEEVWRRSGGGLEEAQMRSGGGLEEACKGSGGGWAIGRE